jgi:hypothetical protein
MLDTGVLHRTFTIPPSPEVIKRFDACGSPTKRVFNPPPKAGKAQPQLTLSSYPDGRFGLAVAVSFPRMLYGDNRIPVTDTDMLHAYEQIDSFVYGLTGHEYHARTSNVIRADYPADFFVGKENVNKYLAATLGVTMPQMDTWMYEGTVYLTSKSKSKSSPISPRRRRPRLIRIYDKGDGVIRVETSFCSGQSLKQLADRLGYKDRKAETLFTEQTAYMVSTSTLDSTGLSMPIQNVDTRIDKLIKEYTNERECKNLIAFLNLIDRYGQEFYKRTDICGYDKRSYDRDALKLKAAGVWLSTSSPRGLPALRLIQGGQQSYIKTA